MTTNDLYLNHAGTSWPKPTVVREAVHDAMSASPSEWSQSFHEAHQAIADFFGVAQCDNILLTPGCTSALAVGIGDVPIGNGQRVLTSTWEHHALHRPLLKLAANGVRVDTIPPMIVKGSSETRGLVDLNWLEQALKKQDVALVAITAACNVTGEQLPYEEVIRIANQYGAMVLIDAAQIVGWKALDFAALGADMVAFGGHKGLQAPWGIGGLYVSDQAKLSCTSANCTLPFAGSAGAKKQMRPGYCDVGSVDQFALAGLFAAIRVLRGQDMETTLAVARRQIQRVRESLQRFETVQTFGSLDPEQSLPSLAFAVSGFSSGQVASSLRQRSLIVGSGLQCAPLAHESLGTQDTGLVRLSVGVGQPGDQIDEAIARIESALSEELSPRGA